LLGLVFSLTAPTVMVCAQIGGVTARRLTRGLPGQRSGYNQPTALAQQQPTPPAPTPAQTPAPAAPVVRRQASPPAARPVDPDKEKAAQEEADRKAVEFEKQRADQDYGWAQYALGVRYMTGKGVEKDLDQAQKWLEKAAKNGETQATKKLAELDKEKREAVELSSASTKPDSKENIKSEAKENSDKLEKADKSSPINQADSESKAAKK